MPVSIELYQLHTAGINFFAKLVRGFSYKFSVEVVEKYPDGWWVDCSACHKS